MSANAGELIGNLGTIGKRMLVGMVQETPSFKQSALPFASLALVMARTAIVWETAAQARGTDQEDYRLREAFKTSMREWGGWTCSFWVLGKVADGVSGFLRKGLGFESGVRDPISGQLQKYDSGYGVLKSLQRAGKQLQAFASGKALPELPEVKAFPGAMDVHIDLKAAPWRQQGALGGLIKPAQVDDFLKGVARLGEKEVLETGDALLAKGVQKTMTWGPALIGAIPAIALSGFALEWFSLKHSENVINQVMRLFGGDTPQAETPDFTPATSPGEPPRRLNALSAALPPTYHPYRAGFSPGVMALTPAIRDSEPSSLPPAAVFTSLSQPSQLTYRPAVPNFRYPLSYAAFNVAGGMR
jgi:hypothetical protein